MKTYTEPQEWEDIFFKLHQSPLPREPTPEERQIILNPWRPPHIRNIAMLCLLYQGAQSIWLRTHYAPEGEDDSALNRKFLDMVATTSEDDMSGEEDAVHCVLNDRNLFKFGQQWERVFEIIPELVGSVNGLEGRLLPKRSAYVEELQTALAEKVKNLPKGSDIGSLSDCSEVSSLQVAAVQYYILVADEEALRTGTFELIWYDGRGGAIRSSRIQPSEARRFRRYTELGRAYDCFDYWPEASVDSKYRLDGEYRGVIYGLS
ncbi:Hypothetical protein D9617_25g061700 [Elsinoe fawcettii]|nr:Hypothetical protein D9617_25g061700 [Elsinoe fawcettii]